MSSHGGYCLQEGLGSVYSGEMGVCTLVKVQKAVSGESTKSHSLTHLGRYTAKELLDACFKAGVNFFDNAEVYANGKAEEVMGQAIKVSKPLKQLQARTKFPGLRLLPSAGRALSATYPLYY